MKQKLSNLTRNLLALTVILTTILFIVFSLALFIQIRYLKLLTSPSPQIIIIGWTVILVFGSLWIVLTRRKGILKGARLIPAVMLTAFVFAMFSTIFTSTIQLPVQVEASGGSNQISFTTYNRLYETNDLIIPTNYLKKQHSDIVSLQEVYSSNYTSNFAKLVGFEYYVQSPDNDTGLISRWPITDSEILKNGNKRVIRAEIKTPYGIVAAYAVHITPPFSNSMYKQGLDELKRLTEWINNDKLPVILGGDYNTAIYSPEMRNYTKNTASKIKYTTEQSWPKCDWFGHGKLQCLRIDYVFIPKKGVFYGSEISPNLGSDHRAVTVRFSL